MRLTENFNKDWYFVKASDMSAAESMEWKSVTLPHTWNAVDGQDGGNDYYRGTCLYIKDFKKPEFYKEGDLIFLEFCGAAMAAAVSVNGKQLGIHKGGYSTFRVDMTETLKEENRICVAVDNSANDRIYPQKADFTFYGGLYRDVNLICVPTSHFELEKDGTPGIKVTPVVQGDQAEVAVEVWVCGTAQSVHFSIVGLPAVENGLAADSRLTLDAEVTDGKAVAVFTLENVHLWNGVEDPFLYTAMAELIEDGEAVDQVWTRFGCRTIAFDAEKGFLLNDRAYPLRGVSRHQDRAGLGNALTVKEHREDMEIIKEIGANTVRLAHYQHAQEFYDLCDENGLIVWAEIPYITQHMPSGRRNTLDQMRELITQCYNHPSIVCWGLSNEITASGSAMASTDAMEDLLENHRLLNSLCHSMDATRPTTMAHVFMLETDSPLISIADIGSYNLYYGWYVGELTENEEFFDAYHHKFPDRVIGFSEYGADANPQYQSASPERGDYSETYQCVYHEHLLKIIEERPYLWATHVWNLFDFAADGRDEGGKHGENQKGLVTMDRKCKKDAFYLYKAHWSGIPFVHICGRRYVNRAEENTEIKVYSNQPEVSLFVDGSLVETKTGNRIFTFQVPISGEHTIEARCKMEADTVGLDVYDKITIQKVTDSDASYQMIKREEVVNWFDKEELDPACYSIQDTMGEVMATSAGAAIIGRMMEKARASRGDVAQSASDNPVLQKMLAKMTIQNILKQAGDAISGDEIRSLNAALQKIRKSTAVTGQKISLSVDSQLTQVFGCEEGRALFDKFLPGMRDLVMKQEAMSGFTVRKLVSYSRGAIKEDVLAALDKELRTVEVWVEAEDQKTKEYTSRQPLTDGAAEIVKEPEHTAIYPGRSWRDTEGKRIQAHGGALFYEDGTYYWYGENKDRTDGECPVWTWGIRAYSSQDLYNWKDLGLIIEPDLEHREAGMYPEHHVERPHILKCEATKKYVCWIKQSGEEACFLIMQADAFTGPYKVAVENYRPFGMKVGDFDIAKDTATGKVYLYMDGDHAGIFGMELSEDLLKAEKVITRQYENLYAPFCREAPAVFEHDGKKYMLTSGMSGYIPNKSDAAVSDSFAEPFVSIGNPHVADHTNSSFNSQISQVFQVPGKKNLYIAIADRWVPGYPIDAERADIIERAIASHYEPERYQVTQQERQEFMSSPMLEGANTSIADYVWLPLTFEGDKLQICWRDEWKLEDFE